MKILPFTFLLLGSMCGFQTPSFAQDTEGYYTENWTSTYTHFDTVQALQVLFLKKQVKPHNYKTAAIILFVPPLFYEILVLSSLINPTVPAILAILYAGANTYALGNLITRSIMFKNKRLMKVVEKYESTGKIASYYKRKLKEKHFIDAAKISPGNY